MAKPIVQVLPKDDFTKPIMLPFKEQVEDLAPGSIRVRSSVLGLSVNTLTNAVCGTVLNWWDTYPVPKSLDPPYNDSKTYGILSAWGFGRVLQSTTSIKPGSFVRGYLPISSASVDLQIVPAGPAGHWTEISPHRKKLMRLYQRYQVRENLAEQVSSAELDDMAYDAAVGTLWEAAYLLNRFSFASESPLVHPSGGNQSWTMTDARLVGSTVLCLAGSGKTAMMVGREIKHAREPGTEPLKVVAITSSQHVDYVQKSNYYNSVSSYNDLATNKEKLLALIDDGSERIVVLDFGARGMFTQDVHDTLKSGRIPVTMVRIGFENKQYSPVDLMKAFGLREELQMVQMNTSSLQEEVVKAIGEEKYYAEMYDSWGKFKSQGGIPGLKLKWAEGMLGANGVEQTWKDLCQGNVAPETVTVVKL